MENTGLDEATDRVRHRVGRVPSPLRAWTPVFVVALLVLGIVVAVSFWAG